MKKLKGTTATGFSFEIDEEARDDYELLIALGDLEKNPEQLWKMHDVAVTLLGVEGEKKLCEHCRGKSGRVLSSKIAEEIRNIFDVLKDGESDTKNS